MILLFVTVVVGSWRARLERSFLECEVAMALSRAAWFLLVNECIDVSHNLHRLTQGHTMVKEKTGLKIQVYNLMP
jgi:hypothetical protein